MNMLVFLKVLFLSINDNLEAMAKQLYDYWFVQFDFPNEEGKPYKSRNRISRVVELWCGMRS